MIRALLYGAVLTVLLSTAATAQNYALFERSLGTPMTVPAVPDSFLRLNEDSLITAQVGQADTTVLPPKSATIATLGSLLLPGSGQIYNESYWKAPVVWGFLYYYTKSYVDADREYRKQRSLYESDLSALDTASTQSIKSSIQLSANNKKTLRDDWKKYRNSFAWYFAIAYTLNILDAYVDAALYNFEVSPNLQGTHDMRLTVQVPIGR